MLEGYQKPTCDQLLRAASGCKSVNQIDFKILYMEISQYFGAARNIEVEQYRPRVNQVRGEEKGSEMLRPNSVNTSNLGIKL